MFQIVVQQTLEDKQRSDRMVAYAVFYNMAIWAATQQVYDLFLKDWTGDINDLSLAIQITDGMYNLIPSLI